MKLIFFLGLIAIPLSTVYQSCAGFEQANNELEKFENNKSEIIEKLNSIDEISFAKDIESSITNGNFSSSNRLELLFQGKLVNGKLVNRLEEKNTFGDIVSEYCIPEELTKSLRELIVNSNVCSFGGNNDPDIVCASVVVSAPYVYMRERSTITNEDYWSSLLGAQGSPCSAKKDICNESRRLLIKSELINLAKSLDDNPVEFSCL